jgi:16S rRNA (uracil1498-N3)-methyltransferase
MRIPRIYTAQTLAADSVVILEPEPANHVARVLRLVAGDQLVLFDGNGGEYPADITAVDKKRVQVLTGAHRSSECESPLAIHLGIALSRGDRMDWIVQKSTELGVASLTALTTERTGVKLVGDRAGKRLLHWREVAISACEQCGRNRPPTINPLSSLQEWLATTDAQRKFVLHHRGQATQGMQSPPNDIALLVGPEGGLSDNEIMAAERADFTSLRLGPRVLRTETAPLAALAILQARWGDM